MFEPLDTRELQFISGGILLLPLIGQVINYFSKDTSTVTFGGGKFGGSGAGGSW